MANSLSDIDTSPGGLAWSRAEHIAHFTAECAARADLHALAAEYERRCEAYDRTVCTGGTDALGIVHPSNARELALVGRNALAVWGDIKRRADALGYTADDLKREIARLER